MNSPASIRFPFLMAAALAAGGPGPGFAVAQETIDLPASDLELDADFREIYRLDEALSTPEGLIPLLYQLAFNSEGELHVFERGIQPQFGRIVVIATDGSVAHEIGQMGWERGDFRGPTNFAVLEDDRVVVQDSEHSAFLIFGRDGTYEKMVRYPRRAAGMMGMMLPGVGGPTEIVVSARTGGHLVRTEMAAVDVDFDEATFAVSTTTSGPTGVLERIGLERNRISVDTILRAWRPSDGMATNVDAQVDPTGLQQVTDEGAPDFASIFSLEGGELPWFFAPPFAFGVRPDGGVAYVDSTTYEVTVLGPEGEADRIYRRPLAPMQVTEDLKEEFIERFRNARDAAVESSLGGIEELAGDREAAGAFVAMIEGMLEGIDDAVEFNFFPEVPVLDDLRVTWDGALWIERNVDPFSLLDGVSGGFGAVSLGAGQLAQADGPIDVVSPDGSYVGTFPAGTQAPDAFGPNGLAAWIEYDEAGGPVIVARRLPAAVRVP